MKFIKVDPDLFSDLLEDRERLGRLVMKAARIMRRDGFTGLRGTLWNDIDDGVEDIQAEDARLGALELTCLDGVSIRSVLCPRCGHVEHEPGDCGRKRMTNDCGCCDGIGNHRFDDVAAKRMDDDEEYPLNESDVHEGDL